MAEEGNIEAKAKAINSFHFSIAVASHNVVLLHLVRGMEALLEQNIVQNLTVLLEKPAVRKQLAEHRKLLLDAVVNGEPDKARLASNAHLAFIEEALLEAGREHSRIERSLRRTQQN